MTPRFLILVLLITVSRADAQETAVSAAGSGLSFQNNVEPVLTRFGCNQGACHGKGAGQNGFRLSLRGYAPELDYAWIVKEQEGRRVNLVQPADSLLLKKPLGTVPHGGGQLITAESAAYRVLVEWLQAGAPGPRTDEPRIRELTAQFRTPGESPIVWRVGETRPLIVTATDSSGAHRDVTWLTQFASNDPGQVAVDAEGRVTVLRPGETSIRAHFQGQVAVVVVTAPFDRPAVDYRPRGEPGSVIDQHVFAKLSDLRIPPSEVATDPQFLRRVFLDTIGTLPTEAELARFLADTRPDKRARWIDELLERPEFVDLWTMLLADLLQNRKERDHDVRGVKGVRAFHGWLRSQVAANRPWNELTREILTATGNSDENPAIGYYVVTVGEYRQTQQSDVVASVAQAFLGTRIGCAKCHNHPLEKYTQDDFYHFAAFFSRVAFDRKSPQQGATVLMQATEHQQNQQRQLAELQKQAAAREVAPAGETPEAAAQRTQQRLDLQKQIERLSEEIAKIRVSPVTVSQPRTQAQLAPQPLDRAPLALEPGSDPRVALVDWMTSGRNEAYQGAFVNRIWKQFLGVGLVEPVDDLRASNPPSHPELWKALNADFAAHGFDLKHLIRTIANSRTYQLSSQTQPENETDTRFYSHYIARRLPAELLLDAISQVTAVPDTFPGYPIGLRAQQLPDPALDSYFLRLFGRSDRVTACACERQGEVTMSQLLHLQNGDTISRKVDSPSGALAALLRDVPDDRVVIERLFLRCLGRMPRPDEFESVLPQLTSGASRDDVFRDLLWAILNSKEFSFNH